MFYVKEKISENAEILIELDGENIFTKCPDCGEEFIVDEEVLAEVLEHGSFYDTSLYCEKCSKNHKGV